MNMFARHCHKKQQNGHWRQCPAFPIDKNTVVINYNTNYNTAINYSKCHHPSSTCYAHFILNIWIIPFELH